MLVTTLKTEDKFEHLWERVKFLGGVIQADHQLLSNQEVYNVLTYIVRPKSRLEMNKWLGQVWYLAVLDVAVGLSGERLACSSWRRGRCYRLC